MNAGLQDAFSVYAFQYRQALGASRPRTHTSHKHMRSQNAAPNERTNKHARRSVRLSSLLAYARAHAARARPSRARAGLTELQLAGLGTAKDAGTALFGAAAGFAFDAAPAWWCVRHAHAIAHASLPRALPARALLTWHPLARRTVAASAAVNVLGFLSIWHAPAHTHAHACPCARAMHRLISSLTARPGLNVCSPPCLPLSLNVVNVRRALYNGVVTVSYPVMCLAFACAYACGAGYGLGALKYTLANFPEVRGMVASFLKPMDGLCAALYTQLHLCLAPTVSGFLLLQATLPPSVALLSLPFLRLFRNTEDSESARTRLPCATAAALPCIAHAHLPTSFLTLIPPFTLNPPQWSATPRCAHSKPPRC
jgi:hypothetical protein